MRLIVFVLLGAIGTFLTYRWLQVRSLQRYEQELLPLLDKLFRNADLKVEHQRALGLFHERDRQLKQIRSKLPNFGFFYNPTQKLYEKLLRHVERYPQDQPGHQRFLAAFERVEYLSSVALFERLLQQAALEQPTSLAQERLELCLDKAIALPTSLIPTLQTYLFDSPISFTSTRSFYRCSIKLFRPSMKQRQRLYNMSLERLRQAPRSLAVKQLILDLGQWHWGKANGDGCPTIYDEQRIHHDIQVCIAESMNNVETLSKAR